MRVYELMEDVGHYYIISEYYSSFDSLYSSL